MGERELREKYGGKLAKAINRAIRAEIPGGNEALDKLTHLSAPVLQSGWKDRDGNPTEEAAAFFKHKRNVVDKMEAQIREKWGIPMEEKKQTKPRRRGRGGDPADRTPAKAFRRGAKKTSGRKSGGG
ncbi:MAG TPA: hypothetical protein VHS31_00995 [Tepidisphaeraceae bacterium]|jgi:hypothetical protein|nr:hypothetical protein [Tepidisphaeraceae bacterium]